jgi:hypothetical protein
VVRLRRRWRRDSRLCCWTPRRRGGEAHRIGESRAGDANGRRRPSGAEIDGGARDTERRTDAALADVDPNAWEELE